MGSSVQYFSLIFKAGQSFSGPRHWCTFYYVLFFIFFIFSFPTATVAFAPLYSVATQCRPFSATWSWSGTMDGPPSVLLILPFGAQPTIVEVPHNASNRTTMTGNYTLNKFPLKSGTQFIVSMLYGDGELFLPPAPIVRSANMVPSCTSDRDGGNVSVVQTVGDSPDSNCLSTEAPSLHSFFTLDPPVPSQCSSQTVSWDSSLYPQPPEIRAFIPGGDAIYFDPPASKGATQLAWRVNVREGAQMVLLIRPIALGQWEGNSRTSPLMVVTGKSNDVPDCLVISDENKSTVTLESVTATSSIFESTTVFPEPEGSERAKSVK